MAIACGISGVNAGKVQETACGNESLSYCIEHFDKQCEAKSYYACSVVGDLHDELKQYSESKKYYEMVCNKANSKDSFQVEQINGSLIKVPAIEVMKSACYELANYYYNGLGVRQDKSKSSQYFKKACDLGEAVSCAGVGAIYLIGVITKKDYKLAKSYFEKACEMQNADGCNMLGEMYAEGNGVAQNLSKAKILRQIL